MNTNKPNPKSEIIVTEHLDIEMICPECHWQDDLSKAEFHAGLEICPHCGAELEYVDNS